MWGHHEDTQMKTTQYHHTARRRRTTILTTLDNTDTGKNRTRLRDEEAEVGGFRVSQRLQSSRTNWVTQGYTA